MSIRYANTQSSLELDFLPELERQRNYLLLALFKEGHPLEISIS
jgi:hypothetical protein